MKQFSSLVFLIIFSSLVLNCSEIFDAERIDADFKGVCFNNEIVIIYGNSGILLVSKNKGQTWEQKKIFNDSIIIKKIIPFNFNFLGVTTDGELFSLDTKGNLVDLINTTDNYFILDLNIGSNKVFCLTQLGINIYDENLKLVNTISIDSSLKTNSLYYFKNKIFITAEKSKIISIDINDNYSQYVQDLSNFGNWVNHFRSDDKYLYVVIGSYLFRSIDGNDWEKIAQPSANYCYFVKNNELYDLSVGYNMKWLVCWPEYRKLGEDMVFHRQNIDTIGRFAFFERLFGSYIDDSTIIAVGNNKTIYVSTNNGKIWELKSNFKIDENDARSVIWVDSKTCYYAISNHVFRTTNSGTTWIPQMFTDSVIKNFNRVGSFYMDKLGNGFVISHNLVTYGDSAKNMNLIYTNDSGNTFKHKYISELNWHFPSSKLMPIKTTSGYRLIIAPNVTFSLNKFTYFIDMDNNLDLVDTWMLDSIKILYYKQKNEIIYAFAEENRYPNSSTQYNEIYDSTKYWLMHTIDNGKNWQKDFQCFPDTMKKLLVAQWYDNNTISLYKSIVEIDTINLKYSYMYSYLYSLNIADGKTNLIYEDTTTNNINLFSLKNKIYIKNYKNEILSSINFMDKPPIWDTVKIPIGDFVNINNFYITPDDSIIYVSLISSKGVHKFYKLTQKTTTHAGEYSVEDGFYIYSFSPIPTPATNSVRIIIYESSEEDITTAQINIYDFMGNKINGNNIDRVAHSYFKGEIFWDCSNVSPGVYFIMFDFNTMKLTVPVIVVR